jgi:hypothetical protein
MLSAQPVQVDIDVVVLLIVRHIHGLLLATTDRFPELSCDEDIIATPIVFLDSFAENLL